MTTREELWKETKNSINDYKQTVHSILAFAALVVHDGILQRPNSQFGFGRRMETSENNSKIPLNEITPDLVAQKSKQYGIVAEAKKALDKNQLNWDQHVEQLRKYDDNLKGWWTENEMLANSNAVMLIHQSRGRLLRDFLYNCRNKDPNSVGPNTCVVEFNESPEAETYYFFRLEFGKIKDSELMKSLYAGKQIPLDEVKKSFTNIEYYDVKPPMPLLLSRLWTNYFPTKLDEGEYDEQKQLMKIRVTVTGVTDELQKAFGSQALYQDDRSSEFPKQKWIREAFDKLISYNLASHSSESDEYTIYLRRFQGDVIERFFQYDIKRGKSKKAVLSPKQLNIFSNSNKPK